MTLKTSWVITLLTDYVYVKKLGGWFYEFWWPFCFTKNGNLVPRAFPLKVGGEKPWERGWKNGGYKDTNGTYHLTKKYGNLAWNEMEH